MPTEKIMDQTEIMGKIRKHHGKTECPFLVTLSRYPIFYNKMYGMFNKNETRNDSQHILYKLVME